MEIENRKFDNSFVEFVVKYELEQRVSVTPAATVVAMTFPKAVVMALPAARTTTTVIAKIVTRTVTPSMEPSIEATKDQTTIQTAAALAAAAAKIASFSAAEPN